MSIFKKILKVVGPVAGTAASILFPGIGAPLAGLLNGIGAGVSSSINNQQMMDYNTSMANSAYQRSSLDMQQAGLNPAMMFSNGSAASTPGLSMADSGEMSMKGFQSSVQSALAVKTANATIDNLVQTNASLKTKQLLDEASTRSTLAGIALTKANVGKVEEDTKYTRSNRQKLGFEMDKTWFDAKQSEADYKRKLALLPEAILGGSKASNVLSLSPDVRRLLDIAGYAGKSADDVLSPVSSLVSTAKALKNIF